MTTLDAIILGIVQGLTEFLPVSSSGHLILVEHLLGLKDLDHYILFDLICHLGTLLAIILVFSAEIKELFSKESKKLWQLLLATLPLIPLVAVMKSIKAFYATPNHLGFFFIVTGAVLFLGIRFSTYSESLDQRKNCFGSKHRWRDAFVIGLGQAMAILPGVSRSAVTISSARLLGWTIHDAMIFSFLLAIPTILGGILLELIKLWQSEPVESSLTSFNYILGFFVSFAFGLSALHLLIRLATHNRLSYFAWYCLFLGLATTCYFSV